MRTKKIGFFEVSRLKELCSVLEKPLRRRKRLPSLTIETAFALLIFMLRHALRLQAISMLLTEKHQDVVTEFPELASQASFA